MGAELAVAFALLLLAWLLPSLWLRLSSWTLLDCFLLSIALYIGAYTVVDVATAESENIDALAITVVFLSVFSSSLVLWAIARRPAGFATETALQRLRLDWQVCSTWPVVGLIALSVWFRWYTATFFSELGMIEGKDLELIEQQLPYWFTSVGMVTQQSIYAAGLCAWGKFRASTSWQRVFWLAMVCASLLVVLGIGRRAIFAFAVIIGWDLITHARVTRRRWISLALVVLTVPVLVSISNVYQAYRLATFRGVPVENIADAADSTSILESAAQVDRTVSNLQERTATWRFNHEVVAAHTSDGGDLMWGRLLIGGIQNFIPTAIYPDKVIYDTETELLRNFNLEVYDRAENILAMTYGDFGLLSIAVAPAIVLLFVWVCGFLSARFSDPFLRALLLGMAVFYALNFENSYHVPLGVLRDFAFIAVAYLLIRNAIRASEWLFGVGGRSHT